jgi:hypothetical protein
LGSVLDAGPYEKSLLLKDIKLPSLLSLLSSTPPSPFNFKEKAEL